MPISGFRITGQTSFVAIACLALGLAAALVPAGAWSTGRAEVDPGPLSRPEAFARAAALGELGARKLAVDSLQAGDLVFFASGRRVSHVGIYVGERRFVHAPNTGGTVRLDSLDGDWWRQHFVFGKRVLP